MGGVGWCFLTSRAGSCWWFRGRWCWIPRVCWGIARMRRVRWGGRECETGRGGGCRLWGVGGMDSQGSFKTNGQSNTNYGIQVGNTNTNGVWRTLAHFDYERVFGKQVTGVGIFFGGMSRDSTVTNRWGTVSWGSRFGYDCVTESLGGVAWRGDGTGEVIDDRLTTKIAGWVRDGVRGAFLAFTGDEGRGFTYKHYRQS